MATDADEAMGDTAASVAAAAAGQEARSADLLSRLGLPLFSSRDQPDAAPRAEAFDSVTAMVESAMEMATASAAAAGRRRGDSAALAGGAGAGAGAGGAVPAVATAMAMAVEDTASGELGGALWVGWWVIGWFW